MGTVYVMEDTTREPIALMGKTSGICYGSDTSNKEKNYERGLNILKTEHGRVMEYPQVYLVIDSYSARVIRELYTHIGGAPTRLQASTRYINYGEFDYITPPSINTKEKEYYYKTAMNAIANSYMQLQDLGVPKEDIASLLPLGMTTKVVIRTNLRQLIDMSHQRLCNRAYWEFRNLMHDIMSSLSNYSEEWKYIITNKFEPKCDYLGYCPEEKSCGRHDNK